MLDSCSGLLSSLPPIVYDTAVMDAITPERDRKWANLVSSNPQRVVALFGLPGLEPFPSRAKTPMGDSYLVRHFSPRLWAEFHDLPFCTIMTIPPGLNTSSGTRHGRVQIERAWDRVRSAREGWVD